MKNENKKAIGIILAATILISVFVAIALAVSANESGIASIDTTTVKVPETSRSLAEYDIAVVNAGSYPLDLRDQLVAWGATVDLINVPDITASLLSSYDLVWIPCGAAGAVDAGGKAAVILSYVQNGGGEILTQPDQVMTPQCLPYTWQITDVWWEEPPCAATIVDTTHKLTAGLIVDDMPDCFDDVGTVASEYTILALSGAGDPSFGCANYGKGRVIVEMDCPLGPGIGDVCGDCPSLSEAMVTRMVEWVSVPCWGEIAVYTARVPNPGGILNPLRELRDDYLKEEYVDRYYDYSPELSTVITSDLALTYEAARLLVKYSPMVEQEVYGIGMDRLITSSDVEEVLSFTDRLKSGVLKNSGKIDYMRSQGIIEFLDEFKEQVEASEGKTFSEALQDSIYYMGNIDTTPDENNESGIASIDTTVKVPEASSSSGITRP